MRTRIVATLAVVLTALLLAPAAPAAAHNSLQAATPAQDARLTTAPTTVTLRFAQRLNPEFTTIVLSDADRRKVPTGAPTVDGTAGRVTIDGPLPNGAYTVAYRVVSADGHPVQGSYRFTVADPAASATPAVPAASGASGASGAPGPNGEPGGSGGEPGESGARAGAGAAGSPESAGDGPPVALLAGGVIVALALAGAVVLLLRRRRAS
ncbi:copper resistance CopC family protein [Micromonospora sp. WMMD998]|uniref:copper resistance CopC family protein n=1 Tax=Micromonospora sp. WMMD998 TaxID=3016092 RepID=UPI00249C1544|nr:copper resistance CopC family protein [Micromonospora sp. WMMD998]WFE42688.1 copper resistance protein CopC [Micromonospora sp. WMMD998]